MKKKFIFLTILICLIFSLFLYRVYYLAFIKHDYYLNLLDKLNNVYVKGNSAPRGRILDIKGRVIVDNKGVNTIIYHKQSDITKEEEIKIAKDLVKLTNFEYEYKTEKLRDYYMILYPDKVNDLVTLEEKELVKKREMTNEELNELKKERIKEEDIDNLSEIEKYSSYFYYLMNEGYIYDNKTLLIDISDDVYASILEANLKGIVGELSWVRVYPYNDSLKSILGAISNSLPKEKEYLLNDGYSLNDKVGISGLEEYYEEYLKGEKALYKLENNELKLVRESKKGNDLTLEIDMDIQLKVEEIIKEEILKAKKKPNTKYYKESYALVGDYESGAIRAIGGIRLITNNKDYSFQDVSINVIKNAYTVGSVVKGASISVGYKYKALDIGTTMVDSCVKLANIPPKCSWKRLGKINDIKALAQSSNYYQFITALKVAGYNYKYDMQVDVDEEPFNKYREMYASFGLGSLTGIDLPNETVGLKGEKVAADLLMNLAIGQYDTYTPVGLLQYINTIANNGERLKLNLMHNIKNENGDIVLENNRTLLNKVDVEDIYLKRVQEGFREVITHGTGYYYVNQKIKAYGKTGTSESYIDSDYDNIMDAYVLSNTFIMYSEDANYSLVVVSPNTAQLNTNSSYNSQVNRYIARNINNFLFSTD